MAIFDKPFLFSEMLRRTIFRGKPYFFNAKDLNKEFEIIHNFVEEANKNTAVSSNIKFTVDSFSEAKNQSTNIWTRSVGVSWTESKVLFKGVQFQIPSGLKSGYTQTYNNPNESVSPKEVKPSTYVILKADLNVVTYADNPQLGGIQSNEVPASVPSVDVEQYSNVEIDIVSDPSTVTNLVCILATIHPNYDPLGAEVGYGFIYHTFDGTDISLTNGADRLSSTVKSNGTLLEQLISKILLRLSKVVDEVQLSRRFNFADVLDKVKARRNLGLSNVVNYRQLVVDAALNDLTDKPKARHNLGLKNAAERKVGYTVSDVAPGNIVPIGGIIMWSGAANQIPDGWRLCNGQNSTPNLSGRFIVGYDSGNAAYNVVGNTGGQETVTLTEAQMPTHSHGQQGSGQYARKHGSDGNVVAVGSSQTTQAGGGQAHENRPPYYTLCYIIFIGESAILNYSEPAAPTNVNIDYAIFSTADTTTDGGFGDYTYSSIGAGGTVSMGSGVTLTNA